MLRCFRRSLLLYRNAIDLYPTLTIRSFPNDPASGFGFLCNAVRSMCSLPPHIVVTMPSLSPTMTRGSLLNWTVTEGSSVQPGETIAEIETDKATLDFEVVDDGIIAKLLVPAGTKDIEVGHPIAIFVNDKNDVSKFKNYKSKTKHKEKQKEPQSMLVEVKIGPTARKLAKEIGVQLDQIHPTGPKGIITKDDVLAALSRLPSSKASKKSVHKTSQKTSKDPVTTQKGNKNLLNEKKPVDVVVGMSEVSKEDEIGDAFVDHPLTQMRRVIAERLVHSKRTIPGVYLMVDCALTEIARLRQTLKESGKKVSVNDFITKAVALSLRDNPSANSRWDEKEGEIKSWTSVDISIAVATDNGLITPIVRNADQKQIMVISEEIKQLAQKARSNKLKPEEYQGGSFTISNLGMFGIRHFCAIVNPPQSCIMAVGESHDKLVRNSSTGEIEVNQKLMVTLTADGRVFDDEISHSFLDSFRHYMEQPLPLLV